MTKSEFGRPVSAYASNMRFDSNRKQPTMWQLHYTTSKIMFTVDTKDTSFWAVV